MDLGAASVDVEAPSAYRFGMTAFLDFEKQVAALDRQIAELRDMGDGPSLNIENDIARLEAKSSKMLRDIYARLTPWQKPQVARHPARPHFKHYVAGLFDDWMPLAGDRNFGDDQPTSELQSLMRSSYAVLC